VSDDLAASYVRYELTHAIMWATVWMAAIALCIVASVILRRKTFKIEGGEPFFVFPLVVAGMCFFNVMWNANTILKCVVVPQDVVRYYEWRNGK
jgi:hypothetical protein